MQCTEIVHTTSNTKYELSLTLYITIVNAFEKLPISNAIEFCEVSL